MSLDDKFYPTYAEVHNACIDMCCDYFLDEKFTHVLAVARGGLIPGVIISHKLGVPLRTIDYSSKNGRGDNIGEHDEDFESLSIEPFWDTPSPKVLIVDDICDSGNTLKELVEIYQSPGLHVPMKTFALFFKATSLYVPDYHSWFITKEEVDKWVFFPWEPR